MSVTRADVWRLLGAPDEQEGSVHDPREYENGGVRWNERWCYALPDDEERWVLWSRGDLRGVLRRRADGRLEREVVPGLEAPPESEVGSGAAGEAGEATGAHE